MAAYTGPEEAARARLGTFYNGSDYDASTNAGGMAGGGHRVNFEPSVQDIALIGTGIATLATLAETETTDAETAKTAAEAAQTAAELAETNAETAETNAAASAAAIGTVHTLESQDFTASGTWTVPSDIVGDVCWITAVAGGAGGGGADSQQADAGGAGGGGGAGCLFMPVYLPSGTSSVSVTIGAAGTGGTATNDGTDGGDTTFGSFVTLDHGSAGTSTSGSGGSMLGSLFPGSTAVPSDAPGAFPGGVGQIGQGGAAGGDGGDSPYYSGGTGGAYSAPDGGGGGGGASLLGPGGNGGSVSAAATSPASGYGGGGGGGAEETNQTGAAGADGFLRVHWFKEANP